MALNFSEEDLLNLGINVDEGSFQTLGQMVTQLETRINELVQSVNNIAQAGDASATRFVESLRAIQANMDETNADFTASVSSTNELKAQVEQLATDYENAGKAAAQAAEAVKTVATPTAAPEAFTGYGAGMKSEEGVVNEMPVDQKPIGSLFGIGHALSVAGFTTGLPALKEAGALVYMEEGFKRVLDVVPKLNAAIEATPGLIGSVSTGLTALGVPFAGLLTILVPAAAVIVGLSAAFNNFNETVKEASKTLQGVIDSQEAYFKAVQTGTTESLTKQLTSLKDETASKEAQRDELVKIMEQYVLQALGPNSTLAQKIGQPDFAKSFASETWVGLPDVMSKVIEQWRKLDPEITSNTVLIDRLTNALGSNQVALNDSAETTLKNADSARQMAAQLDADDKLNVEQVKNRITTLQNDAAQQETYISRLEAAASATGLSSEEQLKLQTAITNAKDALANDNVEIQHLTDSSLSLAEGRAAETEAIKHLGDAIKDAVGDINAIGKAYVDYQDAIKAAADQLNKQKMDALLKERQAEEQYTLGSLQDTEARYQIALDESRKETDLRQQTADKIADIQANLQTKETDLAQNFARQYQDDQIKYGEDRAKILRDAANAENSAAEEHIARMKAITDRLALSDEQAMLDRDFRKLYENQRQRQLDVDNENQAESQRQTKNNAALQQRLNELDISLQQEIAHEQLATNRKLADLEQAANREVAQANTAEGRKLAALQQAEQQKLDDLNHAETYKIQLLQRGLELELQLYGQQERQRIAIAQETQKAIVANALQNLANLASQAVSPWVNLWNQMTGGGRSVTSASMGRNLPEFAGGGSFGANEPFLMSELEAETLNIGGGRYQINAPALVMPMQSGSVERGGGKHITLAPVFNMVNRVDEAALMSKMQDLLDSVIT